MILGLGNPILGGDGVGYSIADLIRQKLGKQTGLTVLSASVSPIRLVDEISGHQRLIIIDSITTGRVEPGELMEIDLPEEGSHPISAHHFSVAEIRDIGNALGLPMPEYIKIYGIEIIKPEEYGDSLSPGLTELLPEYAGKIIKQEITCFKLQDSTPRGELAV